MPSPIAITFFHDIEQDAEYRVSPTKCREITTAFSEMEQQYNIRATYNIVGRLFVEQPDLIDEIRSAGHEVASHSFNHQPDWHSDYYANEVRLCREISAEITGYRSPRSQWNRATLEALALHHFEWNAENDDRDIPYRAHAGVIRLPVAGDDWSLYLSKRSPEKWIDYFGNLLKNRRYVAFGSHEFVYCHRTHERLMALEKILQLAVESGAKIMTFGETAHAFSNGLFDLEETAAVPQPKTFPHRIWQRLANLSSQT